MTDKIVPMMVTAYGVPPADGPRDIEPGPWLPTDGPVPWPQEYDDAQARAMRRFAMLGNLPNDVAESILRVAETLAALRLAPEITREDHRALIDQSVGELRRAAGRLGGSR